MERLEFSLPENFERISITGKPTSSWNQKKSGEELYSILKNCLPMGTYDNLQKRMTVELLLQSYSEAGDLEKLREEFDKLRRTYALPALVRTTNFYESLGEAIKERKEERTVQI